MATIDSMLIDKLGGTKAVAARFGIKPPSVTQWRTEGIPKKRRADVAQLLPGQVPGWWSGWVIED